MRYRKLDENGDMSFGSGSLDFHINTPEGVAQSVKTRLGLWLEEWFLDVTDGTPWAQLVLGKHTEQTFANAIKKRILNTAGVKGIESIEFIQDMDKRSLTLHCVIDTDYGVVSLKGIM